MMLVTLTLNAGILVRNHPEGITLDNMVTHFKQTLLQHDITRHLCDAMPLHNILEHASYFIEKTSDNKYFFKKKEKANQLQL